VTEPAEADLRDWSRCDRRAQLPHRRQRPWLADFSSLIASEGRGLGRDVRAPLSGGACALTWLSTRLECAVASATPLAEPQAESRCGTAGGLQEESLIDPLEVLPFNPGHAALDEVAASRGGMGIAPGVLSQSDGR
jgi:hypothetical protein